jgi:uncharacterized protein (DUF2252 family)
MSSTLAERLAAGRAARKQAPRSRHAQIGNIKRDPIALLRANNIGRISQLVPLRHGRMLTSPFAFYRGSAALQAHDLATTPASGFNFQICGDCHLANFGGFATPERNLLFDLNDFDETHPGPWEWDLKRLAASFLIAARHLSQGETVAEEVVYSVVTSYQRHMLEYADMSALEIWYEQITFDHLLAIAKHAQIQQKIKDGIKRAATRTSEELLPKLSEKVNGRWVIHEAPPLIFHVLGRNSLFDPDDQEFLKHHRNVVDAMCREYQNNLDAHRRALLSQFVLQDIAFKVVGVGSVGTRCLILLYADAQDNPLFLQVKQATTSVIAPYVSIKASYKHQGRRVVEGQRLMQAASDQFISWCNGLQGRHYYVRQLRDMKISAQLEIYDRTLLNAHANLCGWVLARAHARAGGMAPEIAAYFGKSDAVATALVKYAIAYGNQVEKDFQRFLKACRSGELIARTEADYEQDFYV